MLKKTLYKHTLFCLLLALISKTSWSAEETRTALPHVGRVALSAARTSIGIFGGDVMQPVYGNDNGFLFADIMGDWATGNTSLLSPGIGYRKVVKNQIWGAYLFGDNARVSLGEHFWSLNPGIEWMSPHWDMHANAYVPIPQVQETGAPVFADTLGNYNYVYFVEGTHNQYDALTAPSVVIGNGVDVEIGFRFANYRNLTSRVYVGGYHYQPASANDFISIPSITNVKNITGITAGFEQSLTKNVRVSFMNSYDPVNSYIFGVGVQLTFGDESTTFSNNVHDRLLEPVERHVGIIGTGAGTYDQFGYENLGNALEYNNVYFFSPGGVGNGTYGNPMALTQASLDAINSQSPNGSRLYLQGGDPPIYVVNATNAGANNGLLLYNGEDLYGRSADYTAPATSDERPIISVDGGAGVNGFIINSGENTFDDLTITASSTTGTTTGINVTTSTDATVNVVNTNITLLNTGLYAENDSTGSLTINATNSQFNDNTDSNTGNSTYGLNADNKSSGNLIINATNSSFNNNTNNTTALNTYGAYGLYGHNENSGNLTINATSSQFNANTSNTTGNGVFIESHGLHASNDGTGNFNINASNSQFNNNTSTGDNNHGASGLYSTGTNMNISVTNSSFNGNATIGALNNSATGMFIQNNTLILNVTNSTFNENINDSQNGQNGSYVTGMIVYVSQNTSVINITNSQFNGNLLSNGPGNSAFGCAIDSSNGASLIATVTGSQFNDNVANGVGNSGVQGLYIDNASSNAMICNITQSQFNGNIANDDNNSGASGLYVFNEGGGALTISATQSQFNGNITSGTGASAIGYGFNMDNSTHNAGPLSVTSLAGSTISNNGTYGIYANGSGTTTTTVNIYGINFFGNPINIGHAGDVTFTDQP